MKFKIGDRVRVVKESLYHIAKVGMTGEIVVIKGYDYGVRFDKRFLGGHNLDGACEKGRGQWLGEESLELIAHKHKIVIIAKGAKIAFERLIGDKPEEKPKYYNGKVVCVASDCNWWTAGKIYEVVNGDIFDDMMDERVGILNLPHLNDKACGFAKFIELKE